MNIDKLILTPPAVAVALGFCSLMNIDKLILLRERVSPQQCFGSLMNIDKLIQTMSNWFITASRLWLEPLCEKLKVQLLKESVLHADETTLKVLRTKDNLTPGKSYIWLYRTSGCTEKPIVLYDHQPNLRDSETLYVLLPWNAPDCCRVKTTSKNS